MTTPDSELAAAAAHLRAGRLVAFPTETVYGLGADATNPAAVAAIYAAKGRPDFNPLIVHVPDLAAAGAIARLDGRAERLAAAFWPGALTMVLPLREDAGIAPRVTAGLDTIALRIPAHPLARALLAAVGRPLAGPSANPSGRVSPTTAAHVRDGLGDKVAMILDGGACPVGLESTIVGLAGEPARLLRPGGVPAEAIEALIGRLERPAGGVAVSAPGMLESHYAPTAPVRLDATAPLADRPESLLAFGSAVPAGFARVLSLSPSGDLEEAARNLFAHLRRLDEDGAAAIAVMPIPGHGLGAAINDRLRRAAAPRPRTIQNQVQP